jgi:signal transduction histidine kinase/CheY-like chemotaxis protein
MTRPSADTPSPQTLEAVRAEQVDFLYANGGFPLLVTFLAAALLAGLLLRAGEVGPVVAGAWLGVMALHTAARLIVRTIYLRTKPPAGQWRVWANAFTAGALAGGLTWGIGALWLMPAGRFDLQMLVILVMTAVGYASLATFGSYAPAFYAFFLSTMAPSVVWALFQRDSLHLIYAALGIIWLPTVVILARRYNQSLVQAMTLRHAFAAQKSIAEQASLAKSRFLASASHDLRQPVHALGMFIGALRADRLPKRAQGLIDHMDASVGALDELFTSLLDISRLDAGVTETHPYAMPLQPLIARICRDLEGEAAVKGLTLTGLPCSAIVRSDPVLLERVLRNLVVNAVRYTETGRVLVGCRRRGGRVSIEVWDTGPGIAADQREAVIEEFYQLANPDRDRAKGLGLGLAIVRRLTTLLDHPLSLESWPGRGSVFRVSAPRALEAEAAAGRGEASLAALRHGLIVAIDDDAAVRTAMIQLLASWGHEVVAAGSGEEALTALADCPTRPDLIICDYRLRDGENGIEVIRRVQAEFNEEIPALLLTGDTAPERLREAEESGFPLLHKPLAHARLRAAVGNLIARAAARREGATAE